IMYTMMQACKETNLTYQTLKFYCNEGLVPNVKRDKNNKRIFDERDIAWIKSLMCLKNCGMSIKEMKEYLDLCLGGAPTIDRRREILEIKRKELLNRIEELNTAISYIDEKQRFYDDVQSGKKAYCSNLIPVDDRSGK
ncbi:MAG: MerR family transcriptional regulator, partial [Oscillospiraceae bacterium]